MARVALEVNGAALIGATEGGVLFNEPGVAFAEKRRILFGKPAADAARRHPGQGCWNYWELLSEAPLSRPAGNLRTFADLAHAHLAELWARLRESAEGVEGIILVVPAGAGDERLALLLGIAEEAGLPVAGLVESGVAAVLEIASGSSCVHIDADGERIVASRLDRREGRIGSEELLFNGRPGLRHLRAAAGAYVAGRFVAESRFDPLDLPATEQQLAEQQDGWLRSLVAQGELKVELSGAAIPALAKLRRDEFMAAMERQLAAPANRLRSWCAGPGSAPVRLSAALAAMPGVPEALASLLPTGVEALPPGASALGALARVPALEAGKDRYVLLRSLAASDSPQESPAGAGPDDPGVSGASAPGRAGAVRAAPTPTHLVLGGRAWRIDEQGLRLGSAPQPGGPAIALPPEGGVSRNHCTVLLESGQALLRDHSRYGTRLNGAPVAESAPLRGGDRIGIGPLEFLVTREVESDGA